jgi:hypothetical protein
MRYETASTLVLRKILDPSRADHQLLMGRSLQLEGARPSPSPASSSTLSATMAPAVS